MNKRNRLVDGIVLMVVILAVVLLYYQQQRSLSDVKGSMLDEHKVAGSSWSPSSTASLGAFLAANARGEEMALNEAIKATEELTAPAQGGVQEVGDTIIVSANALVSADPDDYARQVSRVAVQKLREHLAIRGQIVLGLEASHFGKVFAIEIESGDYFAGNSIKEVARRAWAKHPDKRYYFFIKVEAPGAPDRR
jgi:hypothetical protein